MTQPNRSQAQPAIPDRPIGIDAILLILDGELWEPADVRAWKTRMGFTNRTAGLALGLSPSVMHNYCQEFGRWVHAGKPTVIPKHVGLACAAVEAGLAV